MENFYIQKIRKHLQSAYLLDEAGIEKRLPQFLHALKEHAKHLHAAAEGNNLTELNRISHATKGTLLNLGLIDIADKALFIETQSKSADSSVDYPKLVTELSAIIRKITGSKS